MEADLLYQVVWPAADMHSDVWGVWIIQGFSFASLVAGVMLRRS